jgi:hypothetical protein
MAICGCSLSAHCCQPAVSDGVICADLWGELSTHLAPTGFVYSEFSCAWAAWTSFPLSKHTGGGDTAPAFSGFSGLRVYLQFTWEVGLPPSPVEFSSHHHFYKLSWSWLLGVCCCSCMLACLFTAHVGGGSFPLSCGVFLPLPLSQAFPFLVAGHWPAPTRASRPPSLFIYFSRRHSPPLLFGAQGAPPSLLLVFIVLIAYYLVSLFSPGGGWSVQGSRLIWPRVVCGSTTCRLAHLVRVFPSRLGAGDWRRGGPPGFSV